MSLQHHLRGFRATTAVFACAALACSPAVASAASPHKHQHHHKRATSKLKEAKSTRPARRVAVTPATGADGLGNALGIAPSLQLAAMRTAIAAAPAYFTGRTTGCAAVTPMLTSQPGQIMAGNFRDSGGNCYVWLNLEQSSMLTGSEICKTTLHEMGHLNGLEHSQDPKDVMFSPFQSDPIPAPCTS